MPTRTSMLPLVAMLAALVAGATGCSATPTASTSVTPAHVPTSSVLATSSSSASGSTSPTAVITPAVDLAHLKVRLVKRWSGFDKPLYLTNGGDGSGRIFIVEQGGTVRVIRNGRVATRPYLDLSRLVSTGGERGLLGMAFAPDFAHNGHVYVDYTDTNGNTVVARCIANNASSDAPTWRAQQQLLNITQPYSNHNGGCLQFGLDGFLWIGMGDGGSAGDPGNRAQNPKLLLGKLLRIDAEGPKAGARYAIPPGQPVKTGWASQVWMIGLRNPWRYSFDASSGALWIADVGQDAWEEIDVVNPAKGGQDLGWPWWEGTHTYRSGAKRDGFVFPVRDYPHPLGESITGGYVYHGSKYPAMVGTYLYADYVKGWIGALRTTAPDGAPLSRIQNRTMLQTSGLPSSFGLDEAKELYLTDWQGGVVYAVAGTAK